MTFNNRFMRRFLFTGVASTEVKVPFSTTKHGIEVPWLNDKLE
jgi:hypothetical protein